MNYDWDLVTAEREFRRAIELNPRDVHGRSLYAWYLTSQRRFAEGLAQMRQALELDPLSTYFNSNLGWHLHMAGRYDEAIEQYRKTIEMDPNSPAAHRGLGAVLRELKRYEDAIAAFQRAATLSEGAPSIASLGYAYAAAGRRAEAQKALDELLLVAKKKYVSPYQIASVYAGLGEKEQAFAWLEKSYEERDGGLVGHIKVDPRFDSLRSDPRFQDLLRRVGLEP